MTLPSLPSALTPTALRRHVKARPLTVLGLVAALIGAGVTGVTVTVTEGRYEVRLTKAIDQETKACDAVYARLYGDKLLGWDHAAP